MARILAIDFGLKRVGLAVTDPLQISVHGLDTVEYEQLEDFLHSYLNDEEVEKIIVGDPFTDVVYDQALQRGIGSLIDFIRKEFPVIAIDRQDESFSSEKARQLILQSGAKQKKRRDKTLIDKISAIIILQEYLKHI